MSCYGSIWGEVSCYGKVGDHVCLPTHRCPFSASPENRKGDSWRFQSQLWNDNNNLMFYNDDVFYEEESVTFFLVKVFTSVNLSGKKYGNAERMIAVTFIKLIVIMKMQFMKIIKMIHWWWLFNNHYCSSTLSRAALESQSDFLWWTPLQRFCRIVNFIRLWISIFWNRTHHSPMWKTLGPRTIITLLKNTLIVGDLYIKWLINVKISLKMKIRIYPWKY